MLMTGATDGCEYVKPVASAVVTSRSVSHQLPQRPRTSLDVYTPSTTSSRVSNVVEGTPSSSRGVTQRKTSEPAGHKTRQRAHNTSTWQNFWQSSLPRLFHTAGDKRPTYHSGHVSQSSSGRHVPNRSSSALPFRESAIDVDFPSQPGPVPLYRPVARKPTKSPASRLDAHSSAVSPDLLQHLANDPGASPKRSLARKFGNIIGRRSKSESSSREESPAVSRHSRSSSKDSSCSRDSNDSSDTKGSKDARAKRKVRFGKKSDDVTSVSPRTTTTATDNDDNNESNGDVMSSSRASQRDVNHVSTDESSSCPSTPVNRDAVSTPGSLTSLSRPRLTQQVSSHDESTHVNTEPAASGSVSPVKRYVTSGTPTTGGESENGRREGQGMYVKNRVQPRLKLSITTRSEAVEDTSTHSTSPSRPHQLKIQLNTTERQIIAKRYHDHSAVNQAVADIKQLMTSPVTTPTSDNGVMSASDSDLMSGSGCGSKTPSMTSSFDSGSDEVDMAESRRPRPLVEGSFRRTELVPTVRRFIAACQQLATAATTEDEADQFNSHLTNSVHAFVAVLAVSRRATYGPRERTQLSQALRQVGHYYCDMLTAAGPAVGRAINDAAVLDASRKAASFAERLSALLITVNNLKASRTESRVAFF